MKPAYELTTKGRKALKASINKWRRLSVGIFRKNDFPLDTSTCPLCVLYYNPNGSPNGFAAARCDGCPVKNKTRRPGCYGTPFAAALLEYSFYKNAKYADTKKKYKIKFMSAAKKELEFLESLLTPLLSKNELIVKNKEHIKELVESLNTTQFHLQAMANTLKSTVDKLKQIT